MKAVLTLFLVLSAWPVTAQDSKFSQTDVILSAAHDRIDRQNDALFHSGDFLPVIANLELLVDLNPQDEEAWSSLVWFYQNIENPEMEWLTARRFAKANPTYSDARYYEAQFFFSKRLYAKVPALLEPALKKSTPPDPNVYRYLAHAYSKMGYFKDSLRVWDAYLKIKPNDGQAKVNRAKVAASLKKG